MTKNKGKQLIFTPAKGLSNPHLQTIWQHLFPKKMTMTPYWERLELPDGDFVDTVWSEPAPLDTDKPLFILFHGLAGSFDSHYAHGLMTAFKNKGWLSVMMHFRGCSKEPNRSAVSYHAGFTDDVAFLLKTLEQRYPKAQKLALGVSLGGNVLANYLLENQNKSRVDQAAIICAPFDLHSCALRIQQGFSKVYQRYLLNSLKQTALARLPLLSDAIGINAEQIIKAKTILTLDDILTAPLFGFHDAAHYYASASTVKKLHQITTPTLIIHAKDDPFLTQDSVPKQLLPAHLNYQLLSHGGHLGFISGEAHRPIPWLNDALPAYFKSDFFN